MLRWNACRDQSPVVESIPNPQEYRERLLAVVQPMTGTAHKVNECMDDQHARMRCLITIFCSHNQSRWKNLRC